MSWSLYAALRVRGALRAGADRAEVRREVALLGAAFGLLLLTKFQYFVCTGLPIVLMLAVETPYWIDRKRRLVPLAGLLALPSIVLGAVQLWVWWTPGSPANIFRRNGVNAMVAPNIHHARTSTSHVLATLQAVIDSLKDLYLGGGASQSFWGVFGWLDAPLTIGSPHVEFWVWRGIKSFTLAIGLLLLLRLAINAKRLLLLCLRGRGGRALRIVCSNPVVNSYFCFTGFMLYVHVTNPYFGFQGRYMLPYILPMFLVGAVYAPRALPVLRVRRLFSAAVLSGLALYTATGAYYAVRDLHYRYYETAHAAVGSVSLSGLKKLSAPTFGYFDHVVFGTAVVDVSQVSNPVVRVPRGDFVKVTGWAIDLTQHQPAGGVVVALDGKKTFLTTFPLDRPDVDQYLNSDRYMRSGFGVIIPASALPPGRHTLRMGVLTQDWKAYYVPPERATLLVG